MLPKKDAEEGLVVIICTAVGVAGLQALLHKMLCFSSPEYKCVHAMHGCPKVSKKQADNE